MRFIATCCPDVIKILLYMRNVDESLGCKLHEKNGFAILNDTDQKNNFVELSK